MLTPHTQPTRDILLEITPVHIKELIPFLSTHFTVVMTILADKETPIALQLVDMVSKLSLTHLQ